MYEAWQRSYVWYYFKAISYVHILAICLLLVPISTLYSFHLFVMWDIINRTWAWPRCCGGWNDHVTQEHHCSNTLELSSAKDGVDCGYWLQLNFQLIKHMHFVEPPSPRYYNVAIHWDCSFSKEHPRGYTPISDIGIFTVIFTAIWQIQGAPTQRGHVPEKVHFSTLFNFRLHTSFTIKICCNRKSPYFEVSTGCGLKFPSESMDDCFSIILT